MTEQRQLPTHGLAAIALDRREIALDEVRQIQPPNVSRAAIVVALESPLKS